RRDGGAGRPGARGGGERARRRRRCPGAGARRRTGPGGIRLIASDPQRRCVGCGQTASKADLVRIALAGDEVVVDRAARLPGRGAYVHGPACADRAVARRAFARAFRRSVAVPPNFVESVEQMAKKRVHEIAKSQGMTSKEVIAKL